MALTIDLAPELRDRLREEARRQGMAAEDYARMLLEERLLPAPQVTAGVETTPQERKRRLREWIESNRGLPVLPEEAFHRASFYDERG